MIKFGSNEILEIFLNEKKFNISDKIWDWDLRM